MSMSVAFNSGPSGAPLARIIATFFAARGPSTARDVGVRALSSSSSSSSPSLPYGLWRNREGSLDITSTHNSRVKFLRHVFSRVESNS